jgi:hypothetical protein
MPSKKSRESSRKRSSKKSRKRPSKKSRKSSKTYLPKPRKGGLGRYKTSLDDNTRHEILHKLVQKNGKNTVIRDLNLRATMNKNNAPEAAQIMRDDIKYLQINY